jgi:peptide/nickel transport system substrate-binding protein
MLTGKRIQIAGIIGVMLLTACAGQATAPRNEPGVQPPAVKKRVVAAVRGDPPVLTQAIASAGAGTVYGASETEMLITVGLTGTNDRIEVMPVLAEAVPTTENGGWKVFPDGRMSTTWTIRPNVLWHDGAPLTSDDLTFTGRILRDPDLSEWSGAPGLDAIESIEAPDARTITVNWKRPYIDANILWQGRYGVPQPKHILEQTYLENKSAYTAHPQWAEQKVGSGPFVLREFVRGSYALLDANDHYVLGRPKIDELEIKFVQDGNALAANVLAGIVEITLASNSLNLEQTVQLKERQWEGTFVPILAGSIGVFPQFVDPSPRVLLDANFRRALILGVDRQSLVDNLQFGLTQVAHTNLLPDNPMYKYVDPRIVKYPFDPRQAAQMIEGLGYVKGSDGYFGMLDVSRSRSSCAQLPAARSTSR